ncbi:hypothetical protein B0H13DRAFT_2173650, partial [Mycena leptocephala]
MICTCKKQTQSHAFRPIRIVLCILSLSTVVRTSSTPPFAPWIPEPQNQAGESQTPPLLRTRDDLPPPALAHLRLSPQDRAQCKSNSRMVLSSRAWVSRCWSVILDRRQRRRQVGAVARKRGANDWDERVR